MDIVHIHTAARTTMEWNSLTSSVKSALSFGVFHYDCDHDHDPEICQISPYRHYSNITTYNKTVSQQLIFCLFGPLYCNPFSSFVTNKISYVSVQLSASLLLKKTMARTRKTDQFVGVTCTFIQHSLHVCLLVVTTPPPHFQVCYIVPPVHCASESVLLFNAGLHMSLIGVSLCPHDAGQKQCCQSVQCLPLTRALLLF